LKKNPKRKNGTKICGDGNNVFSIQRTKKRQTISQAAFEVKNSNFENLRKTLKVALLLTFKVAATVLNKINEQGSVAMKNIIFTTAVILLFVGNLFAQDKEFEKFQKQQQKAFSQFAKKENSEWQDYVDLDSKEYAQFVKDVNKKWGKDAKFSDRKTWVRYGKKQETRTVANFKKGYLEIEAVGKKGETKKELIAKTSKLVKEVLAAKAEPSDSKPILSNQLETKIKPDNIPQKYIKVLKVTSPQGKAENKLIIKIPFKKNHLKIRAERVLPFVKEFAVKYNVNPKLVMAVVHTESAFNPKARSTFSRGNGKKGHAYGLMQLVPYSGGKEAYNFLGHSGKPKPVYLYNEKNNLELGIVYLSLLSTKPFGKVNSIIKKQYLITSAYNTGPVNVARAIVGNSRINDAVVKINSMSTRELYNRLMRLPYQETRDYLRKVIGRISLY